MTPAAPSSDRPGVVVVLATTLAGLAVLAGVGAWCTPADAWGINASRFLPFAAVAWLAASALACGALLARVERPWRGPAAFAAGLLALAAWTAALWHFRVAHVLLGDGVPIVSALPEQHGAHPREPLASALLQWAWRWLGPAMSAPGRTRETAIALVAGLVSVAAGVVAALAAFALAREARRTFAASGEAGAETALFALALLAQGATLVFFGYVEHYAWPAACALLLLSACLRTLRGAAPLAWPLAVFALGFAFHFSALVFVPALLVVIGARLARPDGRGGALRDLVGAAALAGVAVAWLQARGVPLLANVRDLLASHAASAAYLLSRDHLRDFANEHARIGPLGLPVFVALAVPFARDARTPGMLRAFVLVLGGTIVAATFRTPDMPLGYARDWDVFAAAGLALAAAALLAVIGVVREPRARRALLAAALVVSLLHTLPWIALNHDEAASVRRFATLPLGLGRTESTLAWWHVQRREYAQARTWLERSLRANPDNIRAVDLSGRIALLEGRPDLAIPAYRTGVLMRPDRSEYRLQLAFALQASGHPGEALAALDTLARTHPDEPALWLQRAMGLDALGRRDSARACLERALSLSPGLAGAARQVLPALMEGR
ncbi:MAG: tetratricopeptide repeat protein [Candidatus Eisenbacteria bacterium]